MEVINQSVNESMKSVCEEWRVILEFKAGKTTNHELKCALADLLPTSQRGLPTPCIDTLIDILILLAEQKDESDTSLYILYNMIPDGNLSIQQMDSIFFWLNMVYFTNTSAVANFTYWLLACLKLGLVCRKVCQERYFWALYHLLLVDGKQDALDYVLTKLAQPCHVTDSLIQNLSLAYNKAGQSGDTKTQKRISMLLGHCIKIVPIVGKKHQIKKLVKPNPIKINDKFMIQTLRRLMALHAEDVTTNLISYITEDNGESNHLGSYFGVTPVYNGGSSIKLTHLSDLNDLIKYYETLEAPSNILSTLQTNSGQFYISLMSKNGQNILEEQVVAILELILTNKSHPTILFGPFLKALSETEAACNQGMPSVSKFLTKYLIVWDGQIYKDEILALIPWVCFSTLDEFIGFFKNLFNVYVTLTRDVKFQIVDLLAELYVNLCLTLSKVEEKIHIPFIGGPYDWMLRDPDTTLTTIMEYSKKFIDQGLTFDRSSPGFYHIALMFYTKAFIMEKRLGFPVFTIVPTNLVMMCQTSPCLSVINSLSRLLISYMDARECWISFHNQTVVDKISDVIYTYCMDTVDLFMHGLGRVKGNGSMMSSLLGTELLDLSQTYTQVKDLMSLTKNVAMIKHSMIKSLANELDLNVKQIKPEDCLNLLESIAPYYCELIKRSLDESSKHIDDSN